MHTAKNSLTTFLRFIVRDTLFFWLSPLYSSLKLYLQLRVAYNCTAFIFKKKREVSQQGVSRRWVFRKAKNNLWGLA
jgi:hypothetical protein